MPFARNALDASRVYFEDEGDDGAAVVLHGGLLDSVDLVRASHIAQALQGLPDEFRLIYVDHRGLGQSDKPHDAKAYAMPLRVADAVAVLDELGIESAHFIGNSWGARHGFGIGEHAPERVLSLVLGGQQPYAIDPDGPLAPSRRLWPPLRRQVWSPSSGRWRGSLVPGSRTHCGRRGSTTTPQPSGQRGAQHLLKARSPKTLGHGKSDVLST